MARHLIADSDHEVLVIDNLSTGSIQNIEHLRGARGFRYVIGDVAGVVESPVYAILAMNKQLKMITLPEGYGLDIFNAQQPFDSSRYAMKWDGEWHITIEVFRDLGLAFAAVLVLIYVLVVGWFQSFMGRPG